MSPVRDATTRRTAEVSLLRSGMQPHRKDELIERDGEACIVVHAEVRFPRYDFEREWIRWPGDLIEVIEYEPLFRRIG